MKSLIIKILLAIAIIVLAYLVIQSIRTPLEFNRQKNEREKIVIQNLKDIRASQLIFKTIHGEYAANFDTLIYFLKNGEIPVVNIIPDPEDTTFTLTINDTIGYIKVADSLFNNRPDFVIDSLPYISFSDGEMFEMNAGEVVKGGLKVNVFEANANYEKFLKRMNRQLVINLIKSKQELDQFPGLKVGSMLEPTTDGNWE
ncbi:MAG: hypothetical protein IMY70_03675 [Bacteroidetes bacterium]|nr:hypothetical protein [Bacteroidota bacterium]